MYTWILLGALGACVVAIGFFLVTITSLQDMLDMHRKTEDRLRESEEQLRAIVDNTATIISVKDRSGRYSMVNRKFESVFGVSGMMMVGRTDREVFPETLAESLRVNDDRVIDTNGPVEIEQTITPGRGIRPRRMFVVKTPLHDVIGNISGVCTLASDITDRDLARQERDRLFELSRDAMVAASLDGYITQANPEFERATGYTMQELAAQPGITLAHPDDRDNAWQGLVQLREGKPLASYRSRTRCKDGSYKTFEWHVMPAVAEEMIYAVGRQVSEERLAAVEGSAGESKAEGGRVAPLRLTHKPGRATTRG